jgi:hypothetical protein
VGWSSWTVPPGSQHLKSGKGESINSTFQGTCGGPGL